MQRKMMTPNSENHPAGTPPAGRFVSQLTRETFAFVLAGGRGSRLGPLTDWRAKPAVPFGGKFRIIDFTLSNCVNSGIRRIAIATQYKSHSLIRHIQRGWSFLDGRFNEFIDLLPAQQQVSEDWYRGTADAVQQNVEILRRYGPKYILVLAGDHIYRMDYGNMLLAHVKCGADVTLGCLPVPVQDATGFGVMSVDAHQRIVRFDEKPAHPRPIPGRPEFAMASMGIYLFGSEFLYDALARDACKPDSRHDFGGDVIPGLIQEGHVVCAHDFAGSCVGMDNRGKPYWRDVGTIDAYWEANMDLTKVVPELNLYDRVWPIWTHQEQLPPAKFVFDEDGRRGAAVDSMVSGGCIISGATVRRSVLFSDVRVERGSLIEDSVVLPQVRMGRNVTLKRAVVDRGCIIPDGMVVGMDAEADRARFHVEPSGITLLTREMFERHTSGSGIVPVVPNKQD